MATVQRWLAKMLDDDGQPPPTGDENQHSPQLSAKQTAAVTRGAEVVRRWGGVILADAVGLGKTRVAVAMARRIVSQTRRRLGKTEPPLFVVPARLREPWRDALGAAGYNCPRDAVVISHHRLSRQAYEGRPPLVVVDEAHRFRNPDANRSRNLARLTATTPPVLVTATPVCTDSSDLQQLLGYFLTDPVVESICGMGLNAAFDAHDAAQFDLVPLLEEVVIRRHRPDFGPAGRPDVRFELLRYTASDDEKWLWKHLEAQLRQLHFAATRQHWPAGLLVNNLMRMFESGPQALADSLDDLLHFHDRWLTAADEHTTLERPDFLELFDGVDRHQQVFGFLYGHSTAPDATRHRRVEEDRSRLDELADRVRRICDDGAAMQTAVADTIADASDQQFLVFAAYRSSARALFDAVATRGLRVGLITGDGARATGLGSTTDRDVLRRFSPESRDQLPRHRRLRILIATDCLAEGINLQGCTNLVLADLPYSPVKLEQRIGRIARPGSSTPRVTVYLPRPQCWTDSLGLRRRITERLETADALATPQTLIGAAMFDGSPNRSDDADDGPGPLAAMTRQQQLRDRLRRLCTDGVPENCCRAGGTEPAQQLWVRLLIRGPTTHRRWICFDVGRDEPMVRLSDQLPRLAALADDEGTVKPWKPDGMLFERARGWIRRREQMLRAARLAPPLLGRNSAPTRAWRIIRHSVENGEIEAVEQTIDGWRRRLMRAQPPGIRHELDELLDRTNDAQEIIRYVEQLPKPPPRKEIEIKVRGVFQK